MSEPSPAVRDYREALAVCPFASYKLEAAMEAVIAELEAAETRASRDREKWKEISRQLEAVTKERDEFRDALQQIRKLLPKECEEQHAILMEDIAQESLKSS